MSIFHDPLKHIKFLRQSLSQDKKPLGFFLSAGCPLSVPMPKDEWPLIPDVERLTKFVHSELKSKDGEEKNNYDKLLDELAKAKRNVNNIEEILSFIRGLQQVCIGSAVRGFEEEDLLKLEKNICTKIVSKLNVSLPDKLSPYHKIASWVSSIDREKPIEVFTTNYDLLLEQAFEEISVPYFDGFVGSRQSFFDLRALEDNLIPKHWTRLWKIHGSINWFQKDNKEVFRSSLTKDIEASHLIYPSHLKYEQSRKMPYLALIDQLNRFLRQQTSLLIISGYSFNDEHINDTILNALKANPTTMVIALLFDTLSYEDRDKKNVIRYPNALQLALQRSNLAIWCYDEAVIGTIRGYWRINKEYDSEENLGRCISIIQEKKKDEDGKETDEVITKHQLLLGDFAKFGDFLQALIGYNQTKEDEK
jgi:SIR2-like domain